MCFARSVREHGTGSCRYALALLAPRLGLAARPTALVERVAGDTCTRTTLSRSATVPTSIAPSPIPPHPPRRTPPPWAPCVSQDRPSRGENAAAAGLRPPHRHGCRTYAVRGRNPTACSPRAPPLPPTDSAPPNPAAFGRERNSTRPPHPPLHTWSGTPSGWLRGWLARARGGRSRRWMHPPIPKRPKKFQHVGEDADGATLAVDAHEAKTPNQRGGVQAAGSEAKAAWCERGV